VFLQMCDYTLRRDYCVLLPGTMLLALSDVTVESRIVHLYKLLHSGCFHWSRGITASHTPNVCMRSNILRTLDMHMQFHSGGLEALLEANSVAMAPSGAVLLTGRLFFPSHCMERWSSSMNLSFSKMNHQQENGEVRPANVNDAAVCEITL